MCGISAFYSFTTINDDTIQKLDSCNNEMSYRGPDDKDIWHDDKVALAHVRLSIIGVSNGHQPLFNENKNLVLICNGEIYNYKKLRKDLETKGHQFSTESDCEVILHLYEEYKVDFNNMLDGMFAYCLYDRVEKKLVVGRDIAGKKPLYYAYTNQGIVFSSELKVIKKNFVQNPTLNLENLRQVQKYSFSISKEETYIQEIKKIPNASFGVIKQGGVLKINSYFQRNYKSTFEGSYHDACLEVKRLLFAAVEKRLQSEVPVGILLSAGIDSSTVAAISRHFKEEVSVLSAGYKGKYSVDERAEAKKLSNELGLIWNEVELSEDDYSLNLDEILFHLDEPNGDIAMFAQWGIYKKAKELGFTVLLSGNGGDEIFYGYPTHNNYAKALDWLENQYTHKIAFTKSQRVKQFFQDNLELLFNKKNQNLKDYKNTYNYPVFKELVVFASKLQIPLEKTDWHRIDTEYYIDKVYHFMHYAWLTNNCYFLADKLAMAHSIEVRSPFADIELIKFIDSLPLEIKFKDQKPKQILKDSLKGVVPDYVLNRKKTGFTPPQNFIDKIVFDYQSAYFKEKPSTFAQLVTDNFANNTL